MSTDDQYKLQTLSDQYLLDCVVEVVRESLLHGDRRALLARLIRELGGVPATEEYLQAEGVKLSSFDKALLRSVEGQFCFPDELQTERLVLVGAGDDCRYADFVQDMEEFLHSDSDSDEEDYPRIVYDPVLDRLYSATVEVVLRKLGSPSKVGICPGCGKQFVPPGCSCGWRK